MQKKGKIIVTGGGGFIGSALVWALNEKGAENIVVVDRLGTDDKWKNLTPLRYIDYFEADDLFRVLDEREEYFGDVSAVFHLGACSSTTEKDVAYLMRNNFEFTKCLADWSLRRRARFVYASSAATYGDGSQGMKDDHQNLGDFRPLNPYGYSKHLFDVHAQKIGILGSIVGLKYFNVYGPNEDHKADMRSLVNKAYGQIVETGKVQLFKSYHPDYADGEQMRDFLYVKDAVEMTIHLANSPLAGGLFNIGSGVASTWVQLAKAIFASLGRQPNIEFIEMPEVLRGKYQYYTCADIEKLRRHKYEQAVTPLEDAVGDYVKNYLVPGKKLGE